MNWWQILLIVFASIITAGFCIAKFAVGAMDNLLGSIDPRHLTIKDRRKAKREQLENR